MTTKNFVMIHSAVTIIEDSILLDEKGKTHQKEHEICQFAAEFPKGITSNIPEKVFRKAFREMEESCLAKSREAGLIKM